MSDSQHTPLPWDWEPSDEYQNRIYATNPGPANDFTIGFVRDVDTPTRDHNTKLIVHRVNTYPQLVEALREINQHLRDVVETHRNGDKNNWNGYYLPEFEKLSAKYSELLRLAEEGESHV